MLPVKTQLGYSFIIAAVLGIGHWIYSKNRIIKNILNMTRSKEIEPDDIYHKRFKNILDEVEIASGYRYKIKPMVIPTTAMNAYAVQDFKGTRIIGVTEGLLSRLERDQLEAVVAHELAHIISGDCIQNSIACSIIGLYSILLDTITDKKKTRGFSDELKYSGGTIIWIFFIYILILIVRGFTVMFNLWISRTRELRADAIAVRLTRDPLSLAEALYIISRSWHGGGFFAQGIKMLLISNPDDSVMDSYESTIANMLSTHPPIRKRIDILLDMAHAPLDAIKKEKTKQKKLKPVDTCIQKRWFVYNNQNWEGPYELKDLAALFWLNPNTWVFPEMGDKVIKLKEVPELMSSFNVRFTQYTDNTASGTGYPCPHCKLTLIKTYYEGTGVYHCRCCLGYLVKKDDVIKIISRRETSFSERFEKLAQLTRARKNIPFSETINAKFLLTCPVCKCKMSRVFYNILYRIEVDRCHTCQLIWFDKDELELLQYMIEQNVG